MELCESRRGTLTAVLCHHPMQTPDDAVRFYGFQHAYIKTMDGIMLVARTVLQDDYQGRESARTNLCCC